MKQLLALLLAVATAIATMAQPLLVGHRGSYWGVENTAEAFINGAKKGYHYLECDVKVAGDGTHVLTHDDSTTRLGGSLTIASSTLEQLKAETYTQTRGGVTYTGTICTLAEYLAICKEYNVLPVIELKWATGINTNDCSGIPALIKVIEDGGFRNSCIILTSMKACLEYIRTNYPDVKLQFLTGQYWSSHFDWCVSWGIDVDIEAGYFDKSTVTKYHDAGLKVNMWTTNTASGYKTYGNYGCDFITTDYLDPASLPELDASVTFPPNTIDYPTIEGTVQGSYNPEQITDIEPELIPESEAVDRALLNDGKWYVLTNNLAGGESSRIDIFDAETGTMLRTVDMTGVSGGDVLIKDIALTADGVLLGCNQATVAYGGGGDTWKIYRWSSDDASPEVYAEFSDSKSLGNWSSAVAGCTMAVSGKLSDLYVYTATYSATATSRVYRIAGIKLTNGAESTSVYALNNNAYTSLLWGDYPKFTVTPSSRNNLLIDSPVMRAKEYTFDWEGTRIPMIDYDSIPESIPASALGLSFLRYSNKVYAYAATESDGIMTTAMYDATDSIGNMTTLSPTLVNRRSPEGYFTTAMELADGYINLYTYSDRNGFSKHVAKVEYTSDEPVADAEFALELVWENSLNKGNAPEHIDGTNAQQGGAANGLFYVNDCADEKIYIFDQSGCLGNIDGGKGWGCALDDAGNIIVRNDKNTDTSHSLIIYPAGCSVDNPGTPVSLDVTVPLDGQTNFISASGNVLGDGGHVYMWPNGKEAINITTIADGQIKSATQSTALSITGTTAGYVIPINDNTENWIYQVRSNGYYTYNGGTNSDLLSGRGSTTAPTRNNTVGGEYFTLSGHKIFIHNSGANYTGGFTIRDISTDAVITSVAPIGNLGYTTGGNYSVANWIFAEKIDDSSYYIYQYCPANGMAVYRFYDKKTSIDDIASPSGSIVKVYPNPATDIVNVSCDTPLGDISIHSLSGQKMNCDIINADKHSATINIGSLPDGLYILTASNGNITTKLIKK